MVQVDALRQAAQAVMQLVIELHYLAGRVQDVAVSERIRRTADALSDLEQGLRVTVDPLLAEPR